MNIKKWIVSALACFFTLPIMAQLGEELEKLAPWNESVKAEIVFRAAKIEEN